MIHVVASLRSCDARRVARAFLTGASPSDPLHPLSLGASTPLTSAGDSHRVDQTTAPFIARSNAAGSVRLTEQATTRSGARSAWSIGRYVRRRLPLLRDGLELRLRRRIVRRSPVRRSSLR